MAAELDELRDSLCALQHPVTLKELVERKGFREASYRLSLLSIFGEQGDMHPEDPAAAIAALPLRLELGNAATPVDEGEVALVSDGTVSKLP